MALLTPLDPTEEVAQPALMVSKSNRRRPAPDDLHLAGGRAPPPKPAFVRVPRWASPASRRRRSGRPPRSRIPPDWYRHGRELSWLLQGRRDPRPDGVLVRTTPDDQRVPSRDLDNGASNPGVRDAVGLGGAETEAGTRVGTGVEGGGR